MTSMQQHNLMQNMRMPANAGGGGQQQPPVQMAPQQPQPNQQQPPQMQNVQAPVQGQPPGAPMAPGQPPMAGQQPPGQMQMPGMQQQPAVARERHTIWTGVLEWIEKSRNSDAQKMTRHVPCQVSAHIKDGEPELLVYCLFFSFFYIFLLL